MLQRRKKYKNRTIPGYKTLAAGQVNMAQLPIACMMHSGQQPAPVSVITRHYSRCSFTARVAGETDAVLEIAGSRYRELKPSHHRRLERFIKCTKHAPNYYQS
ncbi:hypothetical protein LSH36_1g24064 [Paralvinella palmiformis]|uniref:Phosphofurin acidic cluster sorting protein 1/2 N-terminal C2 domain-containing protein n=1 Tax=Paralvinella palmiformis TaxID=53620 RepID=A0AAD9KGF2_9ANNE|nr:hypothetical protein LSH36_1g24064 [Paralvinella palmiformis]